MKRSTHTDGRAGAPKGDDRLIMFPELEPPYGTIVADPPWPYENAGAEHGGSGRSIKLDGTAARGVAQLGYSTMTIPDLCSLPVAELAAADAHLYVWTTNAFMVEAHELAARGGSDLRRSSRG